MKVTLAVDALSPRLSGIGRYCRELTQRIPQLAHPEPTYFYRNGSIVGELEAFLTPDPQVVRPQFVRLISRWWSKRETRRILSSSIVHAPNYFLPPEAESGVLTVHDLSVFKYPETHPPERISHFERDFAHSLSRARLIITDTETVRQEVIDYTGFAVDRVVAIPLGVDDRYRPARADDLRPKLASWGLEPGHYALCVAALEPRKRVDRLIQAWEQLPSSLRASYPLVLAGPLGWLNEDLHMLIDRGEAAGWIKRQGYVPEADLPVLYAGAVLFAFPSIYEGFGLPLVEAMACGVPVITSNVSCIPEVCGDAATLVDVDDIDALVEAIIVGLTDALWRSKARERGLARSACFTWDACAKKTYEAYLKACDLPRVISSSWD